MGSGCGGERLGQEMATALTRLQAISDFAGTGHSAGCEVISSCNGSDADVQFKEFMGAMKYRHRPLVSGIGGKDASPDTATLG